MQSSCVSRNVAQCLDVIALSIMYSFKKVPKLYSGQLYKTWIKDIQWLNRGYPQISDNFLDSDCIKKSYPNCYPKRYPIG